MTEAETMEAVESSLRQVPHSRDAEQAVIGALLVDNAAIDRVAELKAEHFFAFEHRTIFAELQAQILAHRSADILTVHDALQARDDAERCGGLVYLNALAQSIPSSGSLRRHAKLVLDYARARALLIAGNRAAELAHNQSRPIDERIDEVSGELMKLLEQTVQQEAVDLSQSLSEHIEVIERRAAGDTGAIPTGLHDIDRMLGGGVHAGELIIFGARPGVGKTAAGLTAALHMAETQAVGFLSMEMPRSQLNDRAISGLGHIDLSKLQRPPETGDSANDFWSRVCEAVELSKERRLYVDDQAGLNLSQVSAKARAMRRKYGIKVLVLDYLQLVRGRDENVPRAYQIGEITAGLKTLAKELGLAVIALAQVNRKVDGMPNLPDLKDSGSIEQDADIILFLHRPIMDKPTLGEAFKYFARGFLAKNRQGQTGLMSLCYIGNETRFTSWSGPEPVETKPGRGGDL